MNAHQPRRPAGIPAGGQFATKSQPAPGYDLEAGPAADVERAASAVRSGRRELGAATVDGRPVEPEILVLGDGTRIERYYRDGSLHDPDDGRPAVAWARAGGTVAREVHYRDGRLHDPAGGRPADVFYRPDGSVEREAHYRDGECHDPVDGRPAIVQYGDDGTVSREWHYRDGQVHDPVDGRPAVVWYRPDGTVEMEVHYRDG